MHYYKKEIVLQEVPGEISLCYFICGCPLRCQGCHSAFTWSENTGHALDIKEYLNTLERYRGYISCVLFMGGEWHEEELTVLLQAARIRKLSTCLYTGLEDIPQALKNELTYLKTGPWISKLGGLDSTETNQKFIQLQTGDCLNDTFRRDILAG
ncbi:MAG: anaerobic ribonucleoside-triphosphate reductase activating protein [Bacteroidales bacterium]|nr:anaerobic ribonucleoside-triphosphate reductase activating protein [Bacteroidales bacterium]